LFPKRYFNPEFFAQNYFPPVEGGGGGIVYEGEVSFEGEGVFTLYGKRIIGRRGRVAVPYKTLSASVSFYGSVEGDADARKRSIASAYFYGMPLGSMSARLRQYNSFKTNVRTNGATQARRVQTSSATLQRSTSRGSVSSVKIASSSLASFASSVGGCSSLVLENLIHMAEVRCFKKEQSALTKHETTFYQQPSPHFINEGRVIQSGSL